MGGSSSKGWISADGPLESDAKDLGVNHVRRSVGYARI